MSISLAIAAGAFLAISFAVSLVASALVKRTGIVDAPDEARKQQSAPVPRLGGVAIAAGALIGGLIGFLIIIVSRGGGLSGGLSDFAAAMSGFLSGQEALIALVAGAFALGLFAGKMPEKRMSSC